MPEGSDVSVVNKLLENSPLAILVLGAYFICSAIAGHVLPSADLAIATPLRQVVLGGIGVAIAFFGGVLLWRTRPPADEVDCAKFKFEIFSPKQNESVPETLPSVEGTYLVAPPSEQKVWIFVQNTKNLTYRPRREVDIPIGGQTGKWRAREVYTAGSAGEEAKIVIAIVGRAGQQLIDYYNLLPSGNRPGINKDLLTAVAKTCADVTVKRA